LVLSHQTGVRFPVALPDAIFYASQNIPNSSIGCRKPLCSWHAGIAKNFYG